MKMKTYFAIGFQSFSQSNCRFADLRSRLCAIFISLTNIVVRIGRRRDQKGRKTNVFLPVFHSGFSDNGNVSCQWHLKMKRAQVIHKKSTVVQERIHHQLTDVDDEGEMYGVMRDGWGTSVRHTRKK